MLLAQHKINTGGLAQWLLNKWQRRRSLGPRQRPRLALLDRISLAPRQSLVLIEVEGRKFLVATAAEGGSIFYALDQSGLSERAASKKRISW